MSAWKPKPGDVGLARVHSDDLPLSITGVTGHLVDVVVTRGSREWVLAAHGDFFWSDEDRPDLEVRPLVVIDPDDVETVERLRSAFWAGHNADVSGMQAALRSLLAPSKPDEPTGLGAVVEDAEGYVYVRAARPTRERQPFNWVGPDGGRYTWAGTAAVRVLSEGVDQ